MEYTKEGNINVNSEEVNIEKEDIKEEKVQSFNQLIVPIGKRSSITFTDGSKMWVNAGSKVIYPAQFTADSREIFVEGEIYLDIVHDEKRPFIVKPEKWRSETWEPSFVSLPTIMKQAVMLYW